MSSLHRGYKGGKGLELRALAHEDKAEPQGQEDEHKVHPSFVFKTLP